MKIVVEVDDDGICKMVRAHKQFWGRVPKGVPHEVVEIDPPSDDPSIYYLEGEPDESPEGPTARMKDGPLLTMNPDQYGDPDARIAAGKKPPVQLKWGEWTLVTTH